MKKSLLATLIKLAKSRSLAEAQELVKTAESQGCMWRPVGDREGNFGSIGIGSDPGLALVERVTNAIDAVIEREYARRLQSKKKLHLLTPREAVQELFRVKDGRLAGLPIERKKNSKEVSRQELADNIRISLLDSGVRKHPTVEVRDLGIGLTPTQVPQTILSLNETNKIDKPYLAGAFGQGGSTALAFSPYGTLVVTRRQPDLLGEGDADLVSVTFVRYEELSASQNKNGRFDFLVLENRAVPAFPAIHLGDFAPGTCVVHYAMEIPQYSQKITQITNSMWWLMQNALFDPVLPVWIEDHRKHPNSETEGKVERRTIAGNYTRLQDDKKSKVEHGGSVECTLRNQMGSVRANFWVLRADPEASKDSPLEIYVDQHHPIVYTYNGQTHGTDERRFVTERLDLPYLARFLVIHVELDGLSALARRKLLSSTRDRLRRSDVFAEIRESVRAALSADEQLARLNRERKEALLSKHSETERQKMRERFAKLMDRFRAGVDIPKAKPSDPSDGQGRPPQQHSPETQEPQSGARGPLAALPTSEEPTFIKVANTQRPITVRLDRHSLIRLESDAPDEYLRHPHAKLVVTSDPDGVIEVSHHSDFHGGRCRIAISATEAARAGKGASLTILLMTVKKAVLSTKVNIKFEKPEEQAPTGRDGKAKIQVPEPIPVYKSDWPSHGWDEISVARVMLSNQETSLYVNMDNRHIAKLLQAGNYQEVGVTRMKNNYLLYVAFYAWMQQLSQAKGSSADLQGAALEEYQRAELDRVAQTVVFSISAESRLEEE